jgi:hypothetical protein
MDKSLLMYKILSGNATELEINEFTSRISNEPGYAEEFEELRLVYESSLNIEEKIVERDDRFYDGLRKIQDRIKALKIAKKRTKRFKIAGISVAIAATFFMTFLYVLGSNSPFRLTIPITPGIVLNENLDFEEASLESIIDLLENKYHLVIKVSSNELLPCKFTGMFQKGLTIESVIRTLAQAEDFKCKMIDQETYEFQGTGCPL